MPRRPRFCPPDIPQHVIQRGNNRQACFAAEEDYSAYLYWLKEFSSKFDVSVHAWVLMTNHVHLLCTPHGNNDGISRMMQSLGRMYVRYFNHVYCRSGTLWEGRFKSCLVEADSYLFHLYRYIELNPVRAGMVDDPADYVWSSYQVNALGKQSGLCSPHSLYRALDLDKERQEARYRDLFRHHVDGSLLSDIRRASTKGLVLGNERFIEALEKLGGMALREGRRGRRPKTVSGELLL